MGFKPKQYLSIDTETTGLHFWQGDRPFAVPLCDEEGNEWYTEWAVDPFTRRVTPDEGDLKFLRKLFEDERTEKLLFNSKFDERMLSGFGLKLKGQIHDIGVAARVCYTLEPNYKLKPLAFRYAGIPVEDEKQLQKEVNRCRAFGRKHGWNLSESTAADYWTPRAVSPNSEHCRTYALGDVHRNLDLWLLYRHVVMADPESAELLATYTFEMEEVYPVIYAMEERGIRIDKAKNSQELADAVERAEREKAALLHMLKRDRRTWHDDKRQPFNPGSNPQLARVLFDKRYGYGLQVHRRTKTGAPSTDWKALREHLTHPFVYGLVRYRSAEKSISTYFGKYEEVMVPDHIQKGTHAIHCSFNQLGANKTSRTSSSDPNLQNVGDANNNPNSPAPIQARGPMGPRKGYVWYCLDWSGQEMRIFADAAQIKTMLEAFYDGRSIHEHNANLAWGGRGNPHALTAAAYSLELGSPQVSQPKIIQVWKDLGWNATKASLYGFTSDQSQAVCNKWLRQHGYNIITAESSIGVKRAKTRAKNLGFAKIYGAGVDGVIDMLYCTRLEAREMLNRFDEIHPGMVEFMAEFSHDAKARGYIHNLYGRRLNIEPEYAYKSVNYLVQGTAAEMMKRAMVACSAYLKRTGLDAHLVMPIHDELVFEFRVGHNFKWAIRGLKMIMETVKPSALAINMPVECSRVRQYWSEKEPMEI